MEIETFEVLETGPDGPIDNPEEYAELVTELDLAGQRSLLEASGEGDVFPYRKMTADERRIYELLMPSETDAVAFTESAIPVRVLQVLAHAKALTDKNEEPFFKEFIIMHPNNADVKDPVLYGKHFYGSSSYEFHRYILARWGSALAPLSELAKEAGKVQHAKQKAGAQRALAKAKTKLAELEVCDPEDGLNLQDTYY